MFKVKKTIEEGTNNDPLAKRVAVLIIYVQQKWAKWMQEKTVGLRPRTLKMVLLLLFFTASFFCTLSIVEGLMGKGKAVLPRQNLTIPIPIADAPIAVMPDTTVNGKLMVFERSMDSLSRSPATKPMHDSIARSHPGLMEHIKELRRK